MGKPVRNRKSSKPKTKKPTPPRTTNPEPHPFVINMKTLATELYHRIKTNQLRPGDRELRLGFEEFNKRADQFEGIKNEKQLKEDAEKRASNPGAMPELTLQPVAKLSRAPAMATAAAKSASAKKKLKKKKINSICSWNNERDTTWTPC